MAPTSQTVDDACIPNIGARERRRRMTFGIAMLVAGAGLAALLVGLDGPRLWRLAAFPPFWMGALGVLQAREKT
ncbi:MAG: hypothetical protein ACODAE_00075 [Gemmatimonadota bacterium]